MLRFGLLTAMTFFTVNFLLNSAPLTLDPVRWYFSTSTTLLLIVSALAVYGSMRHKAASRCSGSGFSTDAPVVASGFSRKDDAGAEIDQLLHPSA